jgi:hypothetical protein
VALAGVVLRDENKGSLKKDIVLCNLFGNSLPMRVALGRKTISHEGRSSYVTTSQLVLSVIDLDRFDQVTWSMSPHDYCYASSF